MCVCVCVCVHSRGKMIIDQVVQVQILDEAVCISHNANYLEKGIHSTIQL